MARAWRGTINADIDARRAKIKNIAKKSFESGDECDVMPDSMRKYLAMQALESGKPFTHDGLSASYGSGYIMNTESSASKVGKSGTSRGDLAKHSSNVVIQHLACRTLTIGTWTRIGQTQLDLLVFYSPAKSMMTYFIQANGSHFKIEYPFSSIKNIILNPGDISSNAEGASNHAGGLIIELNCPPMYTMDQGSGGWFQCYDFTADQQASRVMVHHLGGHPKILAGQLAQLVGLEAYQNRFAPLEAMPMPNHLAVPMDPIGFRPASQPNHMVHPRAQSFAAHAFDLGFPPARGHKRQRSRSVPMPIDFSQFRPSKVPFTMHEPQHHNLHSQLINTMGPAPLLYAPVPQYAPTYQTQVAPAMIPMGQHMISTGQNLSSMGQDFSGNGQSHELIGQGLRLDTQSGYNVDLQSSSMSTASDNSPPSASEFEPSFFVTGPDSNNFSFPTSFLSPLQESSQSTTLESPPSVHSRQGARTIIETPPVPALHRSASTGAGPRRYNLEDEQFDLMAFAQTQSSPSDAAIRKASANFAASARMESRRDSGQASVEHAEQRWFPSDDRPHMAKKQFVQEDDALIVQDDMHLYESYLTDPFDDTIGDPFLDRLRENSMLHNPLHSFHRHQRSKPSISTLAFRPFVEDHLASLPPLPPPTPSEEFNFDDFAFAAGPIGTLV